MFEFQYFSVSTLKIWCQMRRVVKGLIKMNFGETHHTEQTWITLFLNFNLIIMVKFGLKTWKHAASLLGKHKFQIFKFVNIISAQNKIEKLSICISGWKLLKNTNTYTHTYHTQNVSFQIWILLPTSKAWKQKNVRSSKNYL